MCVDGMDRIRANQMGLQQTIRRSSPRAILTLEATVFLSIAPAILCKDVSGSGRLSSAPLLITKSDWRTTFALPLISSSCDFFIRQIDWAPKGGRHLKLTRYIIRQEAATQKEWVEDVQCSQSDTPRLQCSCELAHSSGLRTMTAMLETQRNYAYTADLHPPYHYVERIP